MEHDYTACCPQFNVGSDLPRNHIGLCDGVLFAAALKSDWVGQSNTVYNLESILGHDTNS